jgi:hypothetical protein
MRTMSMRNVRKTTIIHLSVQLGSGVAALVLTLLLTLKSQHFLFGTVAETEIKKGAYCLLFLILDSNV